MSTRPAGLLARSPRDSEVVEQQLAELQQVERVAQSYGDRDFASRMGLQSISVEKARLQDELRAALLLASENDIEIAFGGQPVKVHTIEAGFLGKFMDNLQSFVNAIAQAITSAPTARAKISGDIIAENRLIVTGWMPSSFAVTFRFPTGSELGKVVTFKGEVEDTLTAVLSQDTPQSDLAELLSHSRVKTHYRSLLGLLMQNTAELVTRTRRHPFGVRFGYSLARNRVEWLDLLQTTEERKTLTGTLHGGDLESGRFNLKADDEEYRGRVSPKARRQMGEIRFGEEVEAELLVSISTHEEAEMEPKIDYLLANVKAKPRE